jgi:hypothetical protein
MPPTGTFVSVSVAYSSLLLDEEYVEDYGTVREHACAIRSDGNVACWGYSDEPGDREIEGGPFVDVVAGGRDCALRADGSVRCWLGAGVPEPIAGSFTKIGVGGSHFYGLRTDGTVLEVDRMGVESMRVNETLVDLSVGYDFACGLRADGHVRCWGSRVR